jgi:AraC family transcriptional regulator
LLRARAYENPRRILSIIEGEPRPTDGVPLFVGAQAGWSGFLLERKEVFGGYAASFFCPVPRVVLVASGAITIDYRAGLEHHHFIAGSGSVTIWAGNYEITSLTWSGDCELLDVEISPPVLKRLVGGGAPLTAARLTPQLGIRDRQLATLMRAMEAEARAGCPAGPLCGESLSLALGAYVAGRYSVGAPRARPQPGRLSAQQLAVVQEYIRTNLGSRLSLSELAGVVQLSPHHFSLLFRNSVGAAPHQYVLGERIRAAGKLLAGSRTAIARLAQMLGFASQSHFTEAFRRATGPTPKRYREALGQVAPQLPEAGRELRKLA